MDDPYSVVAERIKIFREKVFECERNFDLEAFYKLCRLLSSETKYSSVSNVQQLKKMFQLVSTNPNTPAILLQYFDWFFDFLTSLIDIKNYFSESILKPLLELSSKYKLQHDNTVSGVSSSMSRLSLLSADSNSSEMSQDIQESKRVNNLKLLSKEFKELSGTNDCAAVVKMFERLRYIVERLDILVEEDEDISETLFAQESASKIEALTNIRDRCISDNLLRIVPDIIIKMKNAGLLADRILKSEVDRVDLLIHKLKTLTDIENELVKKMDTLNDKIGRNENELSAQKTEFDKMSSLQSLDFQKSSSLFDIEKRLQIGETFLESIRNDQQEIKKSYLALKLSNNSANKDELRALKISYEKNKLRILNWEHDRSKLNFQKTLVEQDMQIKEELRPGLTEFQDSLREKLVTLNGIIKSDMTEKSAIEAALTPISLEKESYLRTLYSSDDN